MRLLSNADKVWWKSLRLDWMAATTSPLNHLNEMAMTNTKFYQSFAVFLSMVALLLMLLQAGSMFWQWCYMKMIRSPSKQTTWNTFQLVLSKPILLWSFRYFWKLREMWSLSHSYCGCISPLTNAFYFFHFRAHKLVLSYSSSFNNFLLFSFSSSSISSNCH